MGVVLLAGVGVAVCLREVADRGWGEAQVVGLQKGQRRQGGVVLE